MPPPSVDQSVDAASSGGKLLLVGNLIVSFKKISNPGDRPGSLRSYRMSARALPGKTHCELEEIFRVKA